MTTGSGQGFMAGATASQGDTEELSSLANAVIAASGCHNGFNITSMHQIYTGNTTYGDFPERLAEKGVGVYLGSTGYTWISISGSSKSLSDVMYSERVTTLFLDRLLNHGLTTAGKAFQQAVAQYASEVGNLGDGAARRAISIATLYGIPNYRFSILVAPAALKAGYSIKTTPWFPYPLNPGEVNRARLALEVTNWNVAPNGLIEIPGAAYTGDKNHPLLPVINVVQLLPETGGVITPTLNLGQSRFITLNNDLPLPTVGTFDGERVFIDPGTFREQGFFPSSGIYTDTKPVTGGGGIGLGLNIIPVQYDKDLHQTRIWTRLVFDLQTEANPGAGSEDTDGDGLPDYWEISFGLDPDDPLGDHGAQGDPDQDGLLNQDEFLRGTNPLNPDTDQDGVSDGLEVAHGSDPLDPGSPRWVYLPVILKK